MHKGTWDQPALVAIWNNLKSIPKDSSLSAIFSGVLIVFISTTGPIAILFQAAAAGNLPANILNSWLFCVFLGSALFGIYLTLRTGQPIIGSWASTTTAILIMILPNHSINEVVGGYLLASIGLILLAYGKLFDRIMELIPKPVVMGMMAGVLITFTSKMFLSLEFDTLMGILMIFVYVIARWRNLAAPTFYALLVGGAIATFKGKLKLSKLNLQVVHPFYIKPIFTIASLLTIALPIIVIVITTQNIPGLTLLKNAGCEVKTKLIVGLGGFLSLLMAPFGGAGINISAMTAAIALDKSAHEKLERRYIAGIATGIAYIFAAIFASFFTNIFTLFPVALNAVLAGLALYPVLMTSLRGIALDKLQLAGPIAFLVTISNTRIFGLGAACWGLFAGVLADRIESRQIKLHEKNSSEGS